MLGVDDTLIAYENIDQNHIRPKLAMYGIADVSIFDLAAVPSDSHNVTIFEWNADWCESNADQSKN